MLTLGKKLQVWSWQIWKKSLVINLGKLVLCSRDDIDVWGPWGPLVGPSEGQKSGGPRVQKIRMPLWRKSFAFGYCKIWTPPTPATGPQKSVGTGALDHHLHRARAEGEPGKIVASTKLWNFKLKSQWLKVCGSINFILAFLIFLWQKRVIWHFHQMTRPQCPLFLWFEFHS